MTGTFQAVWPIEDPRVSRAQMLAAARPEMTLIAAEQHVVLLDEPDWFVVPGSRMPGWERHAHVLVGRASACPASDLLAERFGPLPGVAA